MSNYVYTERLRPSVNIIMGIMSQNNQSRTGQVWLAVVLASEDETWHSEIIAGVLQWAPFVIYHHCIGLHLKNCNWRDRKTSSIHESKHQMPSPLARTLCKAQLRLHH